MMGTIMKDDYIPYSSPSSSIDSNANNSCDFRRSVASCSSSSYSTNARNNNRRYSSKDLSTDFRLGLSISSISPNDLVSSSRGQHSDWPPIKSLLRSTLAAGKSNSRRDHSLFVKVYMDGIPIGRKLDLLAHDGYHSLITTLAHMFRTTILSPDANCQDSSEGFHVLTYEDKEGDWMMVGDVPWELFLSTVKRLKIAALDQSSWHII